MLGSSQGLLPVWLVNRSSDCTVYNRSTACNVSKNLQQYHVTPYLLSKKLVNTHPVTANTANLFIEISYRLAELIKSFLCIYPLCVQLLCSSHKRLQFPLQCHQICAASFYIRLCLLFLLVQPQTVPTMPKTHAVHHYKSIVCNSAVTYHVLLKI